MFSRAIFLSIILATLFSFVAIAQEDTTYVPGQVIIKVTEPFSSIEEQNGIIVTEKSWFNNLAQQYSITELKQVFNSSQNRFRKYYLAVFSQEYTVDEVRNAFEAETEVIYAIPNSIGELYGDPNDEFYNLQWGLRKIKADSAWQIESGNTSVIVGILDTGTDLLDSLGNVWPHPDLLDNLWNENGLYGYNVLFPLDFPEDGHGHGTHVAGIAGAVMNNAVGVASVAGGGFGSDNGVKIITVKMVRDDGHIELAWAADAVRWAADPDDNPNTLDGAHIANMSWGFFRDPSLLEPLERQIQYADSLGIVLIAAAGNVNSDLADIYVYPAEYEEVIAIASTDSNDFRSFFSNFGEKIEICAPGGAGLEFQSPDDIYSTMPMEPGFYLNEEFNIPPQYAYLRGTSMASPFVSGLAALLKSYDNNLNSTEIRNLMNGTADPIEEQFHDTFAGKLGAGRINAYAALSALQSGISHPNLVYFGRDILNDTNGDNILNVGESAGLVMFLKNFWEDATGVTATISSNNIHITLLDSIGTFGDIPNGEIRSNDADRFEVQVSETALPGEYAFEVHVEGVSFSKDFTIYLTVHNRMSTGFPVSLTSEMIESEPKIADLDGDGEREMVVLAK